jgi:hypothetical protein
VTDRDRGRQREIEIELLVPKLFGVYKHDQASRLCIYVRVCMYLCKYVHMHVRICAISVDIVC